MSHWLDLGTQKRVGIRNTLFSVIHCSAARVGLQSLKSIEVKLKRIKLLSEHCIRRTASF
jgi:hypothetical protein